MTTSEPFDPVRHVIWTALDNAVQNDYYGPLADMTDKEVAWDLAEYDAEVEQMVHEGFGMDLVALYVKKWREQHDPSTSS